MPKKKTPSRKPITPLKVVELDSINQFIELVQNGITRAGRALWYRGCSDLSHGLIPTLYRHPTIRESSRLIDLETKILSRFKQRSVPYQLRPLTTSWEHLFFMQHFGIPTRLLDWTENPYVGLYFALCGKPDRYSSGVPVYDTDAAL